MKKNDSKNEFISLLGRFFTEYLPVSVNASPNTIASYKCAFRLLFQYLNEETDIKIGHITFEALDFELLTKYFDWLITTRKNSSNAVLSPGENWKSCFLFQIQQKSSAGETLSFCV